MSGIHLPEAQPAFYSSPSQKPLSVLQPTLAGQVPRGLLSPRRLKLKKAVVPQTCVSLGLSLFAVCVPALERLLPWAFLTPLAPAARATSPARGCSQPRPSVLCRLHHGGTTTPCTRWPCASGSRGTLLAPVQPSAFREQYPLLFLLIIFLLCANDGPLWPFRNISSYD